MTLDLQTSRVVFKGNGVAVEFPFDFKVWDASQIAVFISDDPDGINEMEVTPQKVILTESGGTVTYTLEGKPLPEGYTLSIVRNMPFIQEDMYITGTRFNPEVIETRFDKDCAERQQILETLSRCIKVSVTSGMTPEQLLKAIFKAYHDILESLEKTGSITGAIPVVATGTTEPRPLKDRFADIVNVKDFGAVGDGVTDDTEAFEAAAATGKDVFVPEGQYKITDILNGTFFETSDIKHDNRPMFPPLFRGMDIGGDFANQETDKRAWPAVPQASFVDRFSKISIAGNTNGSLKTRLVFSRWSEIEAERVFLGYSPYSEDVAHQAISLYRPFANALPVLGSLRCEYRNGNTDYTNHAYYRFWSIDYDTYTITFLKEFRLFTADEFNGAYAVQATISYDGKYLIAFYKNTQGVSKIAVWEMEQIVSLPDGTDISLQKKYHYDAADMGAGQGIYSDGKYIYGLVGTNSTGINIRTIDGVVCDASMYTRYYRDLSEFTSYNGTQPTKIECESESLFFAPYYGAICLFLNIVHKAYNLENAATYSRYSRFYNLSIPANNDLGSLANTAVLYKAFGVKDVNKLTKPGTYIVYSDLENLPEPRTGYVQVIGYPVMNQNIRQIYWGVGNRNKAIYTRTVTPLGEAASDWVKIATTDSNGVYTEPVEIRSSTLSPTSDSTSMALLAKFQTRYETKYNDTYGFFSRYRKNKEPGTASIQTSYSLGSIEGGAVCDGVYGFFLFQNGAEVTSANLSFTKSGLASLGTGSRLWSQLYAATDTISTSDVREKQSIQPYPDDVLDAWGDVQFQQFVFNQAVEKKGESAARLHSGIIAQQVVKAFADRGLDATRYGLLCYDKWEDEYEDVEVVDTPAVLDSEGNEVTPAKSHTEQRLVTAAGDRYGIRYSEALCLEAAYQRRRADRIEARLAALEKKLGSV